MWCGAAARAAAGGATGALKRNLRLRPSGERKPTSLGRPNLPPQPGPGCGMAGAAPARKTKRSGKTKTSHTTAESRHEEAELVYRRQADLEIKTSKRAIKKVVKNKT